MHTHPSIHPSPHPIHSHSSPQARTGQALGRRAQLTPWVYLTIAVPHPNSRFPVHHLHHQHIAIEYYSLTHSLPPLQTPSSRFRKSSLTPVIRFIGASFDLLLYAPFASINPSHHFSSLSRQNGRETLFKESGKDIKKTHSLARKKKRSYENHHTQSLHHQEKKSGFGKRVLLPSVKRPSVHHRPTCHPPRQPTTQRSLSGYTVNFVCLLFTYVIIYLGGITQHPCNSFQINPSNAFFDANRSLALNTNNPFQLFNNGWPRWRSSSSEVSTLLTLVLFPYQLANIYSSSHTKSRKGCDTWYVVFSENLRTRFSQRKT